MKMHLMQAQDCYKAHLQADWRKSLRDNLKAKAS